MWKLSVDEKVAASKPVKPWTPLQRVERTSTFNGFLSLEDM